MYWDLSIKEIVPRIIDILPILVASDWNVVFQCFYNVFPFLKFYHKYFKYHDICANKDIINYTSFPSWRPSLAPNIPLISIASVAPSGVD